MTRPKTTEDYFFLPGGLDSYAALQVMQYLKRLADANHTIILTIHQPEAAVWKLIDDLVLLSEGYTLYYGPTERVRLDLTLSSICSGVTCCRIAS